MIHKMTLEFVPGDDIMNACQAAIRMLQYATHVSFRFNGATVNATEEDSVDSLYEQYHKNFREQ